MPISHYTNDSPSQSHASVSLSLYQWICSCDSQRFPVSFARFYSKIRHRHEQTETVHQGWSQAGRTSQIPLMRGSTQHKSRKVATYQQTPTIFNTQLYYVIFNFHRPSLYVFEKTIEVELCSILCCPLMLTVSNRTSSISMLQCLITLQVSGTSGNQFPTFDQQFQVSRCVQLFPVDKPPFFARRQGHQGAIPKEELMIFSETNGHKGLLRSSGMPSGPNKMGIRYTDNMYIYIYMMLYMNMILYYIFMMIYYYISCIVSSYIVRSTSKL